MNHAYFPVFLFCVELSVHRDCECDCHCLSYSRVFAHRALLQGRPISAVSSLSHVGRLKEKMPVDLVLKFHLKDEIQLLNFVDYSTSRPLIGPSNSEAPVSSLLKLQSFLLTPPGSFCQFY